MKCSKINEIISEVIDNELDNNSKKYFFEHISSCENCRNEYRQIKDIHEKLRDITPIEPPQDFHKQIMDNIKKVSYNKNNKRNLFKYKRFLGTAIAAVIAFAFIIPIYFSKNDNNISLNSEIKNGIVLGNEEILNKENKELSPANINKERELKIPDNIENTANIVNIELTYENIKNETDRITNIFKDFSLMNVNIESINEEDGKSEILISTPLNIREYVIETINNPDKVIEFYENDNLSSDEICYINVTLIEQK